MAERHTVVWRLQQLNRGGRSSMAEHYTVDVRVEGSSPFALPKNKGQ